MQRVRDRIADAIRPVAGLLALTAALGALAIASGPGGETTYAGSAPVAAALTLAAGLGLAAAGLASGWRRTASRGAGKLVWAAGITWFAPVWVAWSDGPAIGRSIAMLLTGLTFALVVNLQLVYQAGHVCRPLRLLIWTVYGEAALAAVALALFRDPYFDPTCWSNCSVNSFLVSSHPSLAQTVDLADRWFAAAAALALIVILTRRLLNSSPPARRRLAPIIAPGLLFACAAATRAIALQTLTVENPFDTALFTIFVVTSSSLILLAAGIFWSIARERTTRLAVARIATSLDDAPAPGTVQSALADALHDPALTIAYAVGETGQYVDASGQPVPEPGASAGRPIVRLKRHGRTVGAIAHASALPELGTQFGPALLLGLDNERLRAEALAQLNDLRSSRTRIVEREDQERRRLERDLHDGAQQHLLALSYELRLAHAAARTNGEVKTDDILAAAIEQATDALDLLRDLAHGIYPAILTDAGLHPALHTLADTALIPVEVHAVPERYPRTVEAAIYFAIVEAVEDAARRHASHVRVELEQGARRIRAKVTDDGRDAAAPLASLADRIGAVGGTVSTAPTSRSMEITCE